MGNGDKIMKKSKGHEKLYNKMDKFRKASCKKYCHGHNTKHCPIKNPDECCSLFMFDIYKILKEDK